MASSRPATNTEIWADFCLRGPDLEIGEISTALELVPSKTWRRGTPAYRTGSAVTWKDDGWQWSTTREFSLDLPHHIELALEAIFLKAEKVREYCESGISGYIGGNAVIAEDDYPEIVITNTLLREITQMGLYLAVDLVPKV